MLLAHFELQVDQHNAMLLPALLGQGLQADHLHYQMSGRADQAEHFSDGQLTAGKRATH